MNINKALIKDNLKTIIICIIIFIVLGIIIFLFNKLLFKDYVYYSKLLYINPNPENKLTNEDVIIFKEELNNQIIINNIVNEIKNTFDIDFNETDYNNSLSISKKDGYILLQSKANNPKLAEAIGSKTIIYLTATSSSNSFYPIENKVKEILPLKNIIIISTIMGTLIGIFIIFSKKDNNMEEHIND